MSHELLRLTSKLCNTPLLITDAYLDKVMQVLEGRNSSELAVITDKLSPKAKQLQYYPDQKLGVVDIHGGITDIPYYAMCEDTGVSHQSIREDVAQLIAEGAKTIVLDQDSPGGAAHMAFESADYIRNLADDNGVKLVSYISGTSASASYAYSAVAHEVISNPSAEAGSIGVRVRLRNVNGAMKNMGIEDIYITAGEGKVPFNSEGKFTQEFLDEIQESVLETYSQFTGHVSMWRGLDQKAVTALGAKTYSAKKALAAGLVDKIMTLEEFKSYLESITGDNTPTGESMKNPIANLFKSKEKDTEMSKEQNQAVDVVALQASLEAMVGDFTAKMAAVEADFASKFALQETKLEAKGAALSAVESELSAALASLAAKDVADKKAKADARVAELSAIVGDVEAPKLAASLEALSDESFGVTLAVLKTSSKVADESALMSELGDEGQEVVTEQDATASTIATGMEAYLKQKYSK